MRREVLLPLFAFGVAACAEVGRPPGGPVDETPPGLAAVQPGSLEVGVGSDTPLQFVFTEKVERRGFERALTLIPPVAMKKPRFEGLSVNLAPLRGWPVDTAIVWVLSPSMKDAHGVALGDEVSGVFTTAAALPPGRVVGTAVVDTLVAGEPDWSHLRAALTLDPVEGERKRRPWRSARGRGEGRFELTWLDLPSGPFQLEVFLDRNGNAKRDPREPIATVDSLYLGPADSTLQVEASLLRLIDLEGPVPVEMCLVRRDVDSVTVEVWSRHEDEDRIGKAAFDSVDCVKVDLAPGRVVVGGWIDLDGDGRFGPDSTGVMEPYFPADTLQVEAATPASLELPWPELREAFDALDSLRIPPVPKDLWSQRG